MTHERSYGDVVIKVIDEALDNEVIEFMWENFFPDEPISRSLNISRHWLTNEFYLRETLKDRSSLVALDKHGNVLGVRLGRIIKRSNWMTWLIETAAWFLRIAHSAYQILCRQQIV